MNTAGLSLEQAPPFSVPLRFFLTAPWFLVLAAALILWEGPGIFASRWLPATLALTHLLVLGFMAQVMLGALLQILRGHGLPIVLLQSKKTGAQLLCRGLMVQQFRGETFKFSPGLFRLSGSDAACQTTDAALITEAVAIA